MGFLLICSWLRSGGRTQIQLDGDGVPEKTYALGCKYHLVIVMMIVVTITRTAGDNTTYIQKV